jgi:hypothetical protein
MRSGCSSPVPLPRSSRSLFRWWTRLDRTSAAPPPGVDPVSWDTQELGQISPLPGVHMPNPKPPYPAEFRAEAVRLARQPGHTNPRRRP